MGNTLVGQSPGPVLTLSDTVVGLRWLLFGQLFMAAAAVLAILVVRETDRRQRERASAGRASAGAV